METPNCGPKLSSLPQTVRQLIKIVESSGPLGTSTVIGMCGRAMQLLAIEGPAASGSELAAQAISLIDYFLETCGRFTVAVANSFTSLQTQLGEMQAVGSSLEIVQQALLIFEQRLEGELQDRMNAIAVAGATRLANAGSLLLYDYSSTVIRVVAELVKNGTDLKLVVPESRTCSGGLPILRRGLELACRT